MLASDINALNANLLVNALQIRASELDFYKRSLSAVITSSSVLLAAAINTYGTFFVDQTANVVPRSMYYGGSAMAIILELAALVTALFTVIMGPGLALRGPEGSMDRAVFGMEEICWQMVKFFLGGLVFFQVALCSYCWVCPGVDWYIALVMNVSVVLGTLVCARYGEIIYAKFDFVESESSDITLAAKAFNQQTAVNKDQFEEMKAQMQQGYVVSSPQNVMMVAPPVQSNPAPDATNDIAKSAKKQKKKGLFGR